MTGHAAVARQARAVHQLKPHSTSTVYSQGVVHARSCGVSLKRENPTPDSGPKPGLWGTPTPTPHPWLLAGCRSLRPFG